MQTQRNPELEFRSAYGIAPHGIVKSPGRICLIGEHTDYNRGFVLPLAMDLSIFVSFAARTDTRVRVRSLEYPDYIDTFDIAAEITHCDVHWANYIRGVFSTARDYGFQIQQGLDILISSSLPQDAGLASSGALSTCVAGAIAKALKLPLDKRSLALIAEKAENEFLGRMCGIMDPFTAVLAKEDHLLLIDCEDFSVQQIPFPKDLVIVTFNSCARAQLEGHEFNDLRAACERAANIMGVKSLRNANLETLNTFKNSMDEIAYRRATHIITENERTQQVAKALTRLDTRLVYRLMFESFESGKENFENTIPEIDALVSFAREALNGKVGVRMTGGGFGGSVIALCEKKDAKKLIGDVSQRYYEHFSINMPIHICRPSIGMRVKWLQAN